MKRERVISTAWLWALGDSFLVPGCNEEEFMWYLHSLIDVSGQRTSMWEPLPVTWFLSPRQDETSTFKIKWFDEAGDRG